MNYLKVFYNNSKSFFLRIELWLLIGCLTLISSSPQGLECFHCKTTETKSKGNIYGAPEADQLCVDPVDGKTPSMTCPPDHTHCLKRSKVQEQTVQGYLVSYKTVTRACAIQFVRTPTGTGNEKTRICEKFKKSQTSGKWSPHPHPINNQSHVNFGGGEGIDTAPTISHIQCACDTGNHCNKEPGLEIQVFSSSGILEPFSTNNFIFFVIVTVLWFENI